MEIWHVLFLICAGVSSIFAVEEKNWHSFLGWLSAIIWCILSFK